MHLIGAHAHPRRIADPTQYDYLLHLQPLNQFITVSALALGTAQLLFVFNFFYSLFCGPRAERNPWHANTLEWTAPSPPPHGNYETIPTVYYGPYEYSRPDMTEDYLPQNRKVDGLRDLVTAH
jgi:cytochrome c oxidase subunit 1